MIVRGVDDACDGVLVGDLHRLRLRQHGDQHAVAADIELAT